MMPGPHIASAQIDVTLDGNRLSAQAKRIAAQAGATFGESFGESSGAEIDSSMSKTARRIRTNLAKTGRLSGEDFGDLLAKNVQSRFDRFHLNLADAIVGGDFSGVVDTFDDIDVAADKVRAALARIRDEGGLTDAQFRDASATLTRYLDAGRLHDFTAQIAKEREQWRRLGDEAEAAGKKMFAALDAKRVNDNQAARQWTRDFEALSKAADTNRVHLDENSKAFQRLQRALKLADLRPSARNMQAVADASTRLRKEINKVDTKPLQDLRDVLGGGTSEVGVDADRFARALRDVNTEIDKTGKTVSRNSSGRFGIFSKLVGSRNDALNIIGVMGSKIENLAQAGLRLTTSGLGKGLENIGTSIAKLGTEGGTLEKVGGIVSRVGGSVAELGTGAGVAGGIASFGVALAAATFAVQTFAGGLSLLVGIGTALASVLATAVGGALLSLGPIIGAAVAGFAGLTVAWQGLDVDRLTKAFNHGLTDMGTAVAKLLPSTDDLIDLIGQLFDALSGSFVPLLGDAANAVIDWGKSFTDVLSGSTMQKNIKVFDETWPGILTNLGSIFNSVFEGISSVIAAISPDVETITGKISDLAAQFDAWASSASGQQTIKTFFQDAATAAGTLWDIAKNLAGALANIFGDGESTGQSFLDTIDDLVSEFNTWTGSADGQQSIKQWFDDAKTAASNLWDVLQSVGKFFDQLDTEQTRKQFDQLVHAVSVTITVVSTLYHWGEVLYTFLKHDLGIDALISGIKKIADVDWGSVFGSVIDWFQGLPGMITSALTTGWSTVTSWFSSVGSSVAGAIGSGWGAVTGFFSGIWGTVTGAISSGFTTVVGWFAGLPTQIVQVISGLPADIGHVFMTMWDLVWTELGNGIAGAIGFFAGFLTNTRTTLSGLPGIVVGIVTDAWNTAYNTAASIIGTIVSFVAGVPGKIRSGLSTLGGFIGGVFTTAWNTAYSTVTSLGGKIITWIAGLPGKAFSALGTLGSKLGSAFRTAWDTAYNAVVTAAGRVFTWFSGLPGKITGAIGNAGGILLQVGKDIVNGLVKGIQDMASAPVQAVKHIGSAITSGVKSVLGIKSPSTVFHQIGVDINRGLATGLLTSATQVTSATQKVSDQVTAAGNQMVKDQANKLITARKEANDQIRAYNRTHKKDIAVLPTLNMTEATALAKKQLAPQLKAFSDFSKEITAQAKTTKGFKASDLLFSVPANLTATDLAKKLTTQADNIATAVGKGKLTLEDLAKSRESLATQIKTATDNLQDAISVRNDFADQVKGAALDYASLLNAQPITQGAKVTTADIVKSLQDRYSALSTFQKNIDSLAKAGLNQTSLQQIVEAGVDSGGDYAAALAAAAPATISQVNSLQKKINTAAGSLGTDTSKQFYQAGVDAATGIVNGLKSQDKQLASAMTTLANNLLTQFKKTLGIKSPSKVFALQVGVPIAQGIAQGILGSRAVVGSAVAAVTPPGVPAGSGGYTGGGNVNAPAKSIYVADGAIRVSTVVQDPQQVARKTIDQLVTLVR